MSLFFAQNTSDEIPIFDTINIGSQTWMSFNMSINDGGGGVLYPNGDSGNNSEYGLLYTIEAAQRIALLIPGWRVPTLADFNTLSSTLTPSVGGKMKETGFDYFQTPNNGATNSSGFNGRAAGSWNSAGFYSNFYLWNQLITSTYDGGSDINYMVLKYNDDALSISTGDSSNAYSVRLIEE